MEGIVLRNFFGLFDDENDTTTSTNGSTQDTSNTSMSNTQSQDYSTNNQSQGTEGSLQLHKEELDISKSSTTAGEVILSKDVVEEQKVADVPVSHDEVVIERRTVNNEMSNSTIGGDETIRIPVSEEHVEVSKHTVTTGEVSAYKRSVQQTEHIEETLRREEARVNSTGTVNIISSENATSPTTSSTNQTSSTVDIQANTTDPLGNTTNTSQSGTSYTSGSTPINTNASVAEVSDNNYNGDLTPS
jgi:uncharacterized protein (TIGR02271 family)